jgi:hypothetical protein
MKTWTFIDKSSWGEGKWNTEPDKAQWTDSETSLICLIVRQPNHGALCGYVGVNQSHPYFELDYLTDEIESLQIHGGITFTDFCQEDNKEFGICHIPQPGQSDKVWWIGFDCCHAGDICPGYAWVMRTRDWQTYKDFDYLKAEVKSLAHQLALVAVK